MSLTRLQEKLYRDDGGGGGSSPFFVYSRRQIVSNVEAYNSALATVNLPYSIGYSVKVKQFSRNCLFYRAMYFSAKRGIAIACRLSVCL